MFYFKVVTISFLHFLHFVVDIRHRLSDIPARHFAARRPVGPGIPPTPRPLCMVGVSALAVGLDRR